MSIRIIEDRLASYDAASTQEEEQALREITQEVALFALYNQDFFKQAAFQGGTCLRIFHGLNRFSEDLDFALMTPDARFDFKPYTAPLIRSFEAFGYDVSIIDRTRADDTVKKIFIKDDSIGEMLNLAYRKTGGSARAIRIKLEIDTNPPSGADVENRYHDFPLDFAVTAHSPQSLFAGKVHAILCREYTKGRDWYDFLWYVNKRIGINLALLGNALFQTGPWNGQSIEVTASWFLGAMEEKIRATDWSLAADDVKRFLKAYELKSLDLWSTEFFLEKHARLRDTLMGAPA